MGYLLLGFACYSLVALRLTFSLFISVVWMFQLVVCLYSLGLLCGLLFYCVLLNSGVVW